MERENAQQSDPALACPPVCPLALAGTSSYSSQGKPLSGPTLLPGGPDNHPWVPPIPALLLL